MLKFKEPVLDDISWVRKIFYSSNTFGSDNTFGNVFFWKDFTKIKILNHNGFILRKYVDGEEKYRFPVGFGDLKSALYDILNDAKENNIQLIFGGITEEEKCQLETLMPDKFDYVEEKSKEDYIYKTKDLINLTGKKYHSKRNHISKFNKLYSWKYEDINENNINECKEFIDEWFSENIEIKQKSILYEKKAIDLAFQNYEYFNLIGGLIRIDEKIAALTVAEKINDSIVDIHFEKALSRYEGLYSVINNEFAKRNLASYTYVNREEDMGIDGLRKAKKSYHPCRLLKRYEAVFKGV